LPPTRMVIPGLWKPLWDKIYAENARTLSQNSSNFGVVTAEDLSKAQTDLQTEISEKALAKAKQEADPKEILWPKLVTSEVTAVNFNAKAGDELSEFTGTMKLRLIVVSFDESQVVTLGQNKIKSTLPDGKQLVNLDPKTFSYSIVSYDPTTNIATAKVSFSGDFSISGITDLIDKSKLIGLMEEEVKTYLSQFSEIKSVEIKFRPAWLKKTPLIADKIEIQIAQ